ncbi:MAG TPA: NADH-quinone oxidoreductase subunit L [Candidatus Sulfopaludibacter sp.]|jgi:NADH-quinone oxidoreductase subunit L|nr:NADH-quinone oxidoreductase subunit L [Candidatus Sulfopaludibacter sp.]
MQLWLIPILPLAGFVINGVFGRRFSKGLVSSVAIGSVVLAFAWALRVILALGDLNSPYTEHYFTWIQSGFVNIACDLAVDRLTVVMLMVVTGIGSLIHIYATGYMAHEHGPNFGGFYRFFAYLNLFMFFMLTLVLAANYLLLFVGWEGVGLCSYLLIGFYFDKKFATNAGNKAFIVNRIGDFGFSLAMFSILITFKSLNFATVFQQAPGVSEATLTTIGLLLLVGACGKSAQIPLYVWLPDAMAGPTPVSALIHAATMVTAGVYMCARSWPIYVHAPAAMNVIALIGIATAAFAATIGLAQNDIKKVFAYSTVSQLGYMFVGVGCGAFSAGVYHLMTHAFFKALLFLGSGSVIHALSGEQDMRNMGGLRKKIPWTFGTMMCGALAISGVPFTSGFFSKDSILIAAYAHAPWMFWVGVVTAGMTAFYVFRAMFMTFFGTYRGHEHPHESSPVMYLPLVVLAALSLGGGFIRIPAFLEHFFPTREVPEDMTLMAISVAFGLGGIALAYLMYVLKPGMADSLAGSVKGLYTLVYNKYFVDEIYDAAVVTPLVSGSRVVLWQTVDAGLIDGMVNGVATVARKIGSLLRMPQSGNIRSYASWVLLGSVLVIVTIVGILGGVK